MKTNERVRTTLFIARLLPLFDVFGEEEEALRRLRRAGVLGLGQGDHHRVAETTFSSTEHSGQLMFSPTSIS